MTHRSTLASVQTLVFLSSALWSIASAAQSAPAFDVTEKSILELQSAQSAGQTTSRKLLEAYLARIAAYDQAGPKLNTIVTLNPKALAQADALDQERKTKGPRGPLHGIPILVKDNFETRDTPTSGGTLALATFQPAQDAFQVRRLRDAGAVIVGKTALHELAAGITTNSSLTGSTRNPYDPARTPGGSSGGTAAAVAASFAAAGMGSDTCGSIRIPAANQNLVGLRVTGGLSSRAGIVPLSSTMDVAGPLARSMSDLAIMLDATVGSDPNDKTTATAQLHIPTTYRQSSAASLLKGVRIGVLGLLFGSAPEDGEVNKLVRKALDSLKSQGAELVDVAVPQLVELMVASNVTGHEFKFDLADYLSQHPNAPVKSLGEIIDLGLHHELLDGVLRLRNQPLQRDTDAYKQALGKRRELRDAMLALFDTHRLNAIAYPVLQRKAALVGDAQLGATCPLSSNTGLPALSVPAGLTDDGVPVGMELLGKAFDEPTLMSLGFAWEQLSQLRRAPYSTPPLVNGRAPQPIQIVSVVRSEGDRGASAQVRFTYDVTKNRLDFNSSVSNLEAAEIIALTLHRKVDGKPGPIIAHLLKATQASNVDTITLKAIDRDALAKGNLYVQLFTRQRPLGVASTPLRLNSEPSL